MIPISAKLRVARPTDNLARITEMYINGLGFKLLGSFEGHNGFDGSIIGHALHSYHLEFTHHRGTTVGKAPTQDNLLVFYFSVPSVFEACCRQMVDAGFVRVKAYNAQPTRNHYFESSPFRLCSLTAPLDRCY
jgi:hypothetical protein